MRAIILAAGSGLRLGQHTKDIPKALLDLNGKSILERQISLLRQHGINEIFVVTGYQQEKHTLKSTKNPGGVKYFLYKRDNKVGFAQGDMGASVVSFKKEETDTPPVLRICTKIHLYV